MTLTTVARQTFNARTLVLVLVAAAAFVASRVAGTWAAKHHAALRYAPGLALVAAGVSYGAKRTPSRIHGLGVSVGAGVEIVLALAERYGVLARLGVR